MLVRPLELDEVVMAFIRGFISHSRETCAGTVGISHMILSYMMLCCNRKVIIRMSGPCSQASQSLEP